MIQTLIELGLSSYEASAYLVLVKEGVASASHVSQHARIPKQRVYDVLSGLASKGFCVVRSTSPKTYGPVHPAIALERLRQLQADEFRKEELRRHVEAKQVLLRLEPIYNNSMDPSEDSPSVELVHDRAVAVGRFRELLRVCANSVCFTLKVGSFSGAMFDAVKLQEVVANKGVSCRAIVENPALNDPSIEGWLKELAQNGATIRTVNSLPVELSVFDSQYSILSMPEEQETPERSTSVVIQHTPTAEFIRFGFDKLWVEGSAFKTKVRK